MVLIPFAKRIWLIAQFELVRLFLTRTGVLSVSAFLLVWALLLYYPISSAVEWLSTPAFEDIAERLFGAMGLRELLTWPVAELVIYWMLAVYSFVLFAIVFSCDQTCGDRARGTLRFLSLRSTRSEIVFGRFLGQLVIMALLVIFTLLATMILVLVRAPSLLLIALPLCIDIFIQLLILILPFVALMSLVNSVSLSAKRCLIYTILFFTLWPIFVASLAYFFAPASYLYLLTPGVQIEDVINPANTTFVTYLIPISQTIGFLALATWMHQRSSL
ncbi:ABC transporter permease subunit [Thalassotalea aquiviva]|uniref:ABC transporter permease subunit n=1 Tax=Thalassotalea aquiviva TaxID=3242415 RepID=UPI00352AA5B9